jgi:HEAT repeat protein
MKRRLLAPLVLAGTMLAIGRADAQSPPIFPRRPPQPTSPPSRPLSPSPAPFGQSPTDLRGRFGVDMAARLLQSLDPEDRLRGIERAGAAEGTEAVALLLQQVEPSSQTRTDPRAMILVARGLARVADQDKARGALLTILSSSQPSVVARSGDDGDPIARMQLARQTAALALAASRDERASEALAGAARASGLAQGPALLALAAYPPPMLHSRLGVSVLPPGVIHLLAATGDLRTLDAIRASVKSPDASSRAAALVALGELGDARAIELAKNAMGERDARVRAAAGEALVLLDAPEKGKAVEALLGDDATFQAGLKLAERVSGEAITKALVARLATTSDGPMRSGIVAALGRSTDPQAIKALLGTIRDRALSGDVAQAIARSPNAYAPAAVEAMLAHPEFKRLGVRAWAVRALVRGDRTPTGRDLAERFASSADANERAVGVSALVALGHKSAADALADRDPRVRRAAATASLARLDAATKRLLASMYASEKDAATQQVLAIGLLDGDPDALVTTTMLVDRAESGGPDAPLCALALARRADEKLMPKVAALLSSRDPVLRAHAARGLGMSDARDAVGYLANAYKFEADPGVRRAIVRALVTRAGNDATAPAREATLHVAARLDPDPVARFLASRALSDRVAPLGEPTTTEVAWLRALTVDGTAPPSGLVGVLRRSDDLAVPVAFDDEGYALVPGTPPGEAHLVLAPRLPTYDPSGR